MKVQIALVGAIIGFISSGIPGAVIGFLLGMYIDFITKEGKEGSSSDDAAEWSGASGQNNQTNDFGIALLVLVAAIMNADGVTMKSELELVKRMLVRTYGEARARHMLLMLREMMKQKQDVALVCRQIRTKMAYSQRLELMHILFRISRADGDINSQELTMLQYIGVNLGITTPDFLSLRAMFISSPDSDYQILDVSPDAIEEDVKKAFRKMAMRFHPDRLQGLGESEKNAAKDKFIKVQKAYENIKKRKGWS